jgi:hypothetical protein
VETVDATAIVIVHGEEDVVTYFELQPPDKPSKKKNFDISDSYSGSQNKSSSNNAS